MRHDQSMDNGQGAGSQSSTSDTVRDRSIRVLALEYQALRAELTMRLSARYQFVGFITGAAALIGAGIGYSSFGLKTWILASLGVAVITVGLIGFYRMGFHVIHLAHRLSVVEERINALAEETGAAKLLTWASGRRPPALWETLSLGYPFARERGEQPNEPGSSEPITSAPLLSDSEASQNGGAECST